MSRDNPIRWYRQFWPRPLREDVAVRLAEGWASDQRSPVVVLEARSTAGQVSYLLGSPASDMGVVRSSLLGLCPDVQLVPEPRPNHPADGQPPARPALQLGASLRASTRHRALKSADLPGRSRTVLAALSRTKNDEHLVLQLVLGPRRVPLAVPNQSPSSVVMPWWQTAWYGNRGQVDPEKRAALRSKVAEHGFACSVRIGARAATPRRREQLVLGALAALRGSETPGLRLRLTREPAQRIQDVSQPWRWPLRLGVHELLAIAGWPIAGQNDDELPGMPPAHPAPLPPGRPAAAQAKTHHDADRVLALSAAPGMSVPLVLPIADQLRHLHLNGPTGSGKSTVLTWLALADIAAGRGLIVIDPKGDLVDDILARVPEHRRGDIAVLDPADRGRPMGFNPLATDGSPAAAELAADGLLAVFHQLWADSWGPRTQDILHASLLTLTRRRDASLVMLPLLLTNPGFRRSLVQQAVREDPLALGPFWGWYEHLSDGERAAVIAPCMNKIRSFLLRPTMRAVLGQVNPAFQLRQVFTERKVLLVSLSKGLVGPEASQLLGALIVADLWQATLQRAAIPREKRHPVHLAIDEAQDYMALPNNLSDALVQARGLGVGITMANQHLDQFPKDMREAVLANARSRVCFQLAPADAAVMAKGHPEIQPADFTALGAYQVYVSLHDHRAELNASRYVFGRTRPLDRATTSAAAMRKRSRQRWGRPLGEVEAGFATLIGGDDQAAGQPVGRRRLKSTGAATDDPGARS